MFLPEKSKRMLVCKVFFNESAQFRNTFHGRFPPPLTAGLPPSTKKLFPHPWGGRNTHISYPRNVQNHFSKWVSGLAHSVLLSFIPKNFLNQMKVRNPWFGGGGGVFGLIKHGFFPVMELERIFFRWTMRNGV